MTRPETPSRHGRAADALIASYVRELLAEEELRAVPSADPAGAAPPLPAVLDAAEPAAASADATL